MQIRTQHQRNLASWRNRLLQEVLIVGLGYLVYSQVRGLAADRVIDAFSNGYRVIELERELGIFTELAVQAWVLPHDALLHAFNFVYFYGLFPVLLPSAAWLFLRRPQIYVQARNAFLISGAIAVCFYLALPTAPPRLMGIGFIDTLSYSFTPTYSSIPGVNQFAAVPSMHVGWNFLLAVMLFQGLAGSRFRWVVMLLPISMFSATVVTGNHYFVDGLLGLLVAGASLLIAWFIRRFSEKRAALAAEKVGLNQAAEPPPLI